MDSNTLVVVVVSGLLGFFMVKFFQMKKEIARNDLDREMDMIYRSIDDVRTNLEKDVEKLTNKINNVQSEMYTEFDNRFYGFSKAINDCESRISSIEIYTNKVQMQPSLYDNVP
jgi:peptidoglycan hydrolase CwlO-like protein